MPRRKDPTRRSRRPIACLRLNGASSTTAVTSFRGRRCGDGDRTARDGVTDQHRRAAHVAHESDEVVAMLVRV